MCILTGLAPHFTLLSLQASHTHSEEEIIFLDLVTSIPMNDLNL